VSGFYYCCQYHCCCSALLPLPAPLLGRESGWLVPTLLLLL
jgi:hypothetical protein